MAGSYQHIVNNKNEFIGIDLIDNLGDAHEALEECYNMIQFLTGGDKTTIFQAYHSHIAKVNPENAKQLTESRYWSE